MTDTAPNLDDLIAVTDCRNFRPKPHHLVRIRGQDGCAPLTLLVPGESDETVNDVAKMLRAAVAEGYRLGAMGAGWSKLQPQEGDLLLYRPGPGWHPTVADFEALTESIAKTGVRVALGVLADGEDIWGMPADEARRLLAEIATIADDQEPL